MAQSTGSPILDNATTSASAAGVSTGNSVSPKFRVPITFTMTGAQF